MNSCRGSVDHEVLRAQAIAPGVTALTALIDLACVMRDYEHFHSTGRREIWLPVRTGVNTIC